MPLSTRKYRYAFSKRVSRDRMAVCVRARAPGACARRALSIKHRINFSILQFFNHSINQLHCESNAARPLHAPLAARGRHHEAPDHPSRVLELDGRVEGAPELCGDVPAARPRGQQHDRRARVPVVAALRAFRMERYHKTDLHGDNSILLHLQQHLVERPRKVREVVRGGIVVLEVRRVARELRTHRVTTILLPPSHAEKCKRQTRKKDNHKNTQTPKCLFYIKK